MISALGSGQQTCAPDRLGGLRLAGTQHAQRSVEHVDTVSYKLWWLMDTRDKSIRWREDGLLFFTALVLKDNLLSFCKQQDAQMQLDKL